METQQPDLVGVPGFGFYPSSLWSIFSPMRRVNGGNHSDEEVCGMLGIYWMMEREGVDKVEVECPPQWDGVTACIPSAPVNQLAILPCIKEYDGQFFDTKYNISKICLEEGKWDNYTNYTDCLDHPLDGGRGGAVEEWGVFIFLLGYTVSIITLLLAIFIFLYFREMRCLRHKIHLNLFLSLLTANMDWVLSYGVQHFIVMFHDDKETLSALSTVNCILHVLLRYFHLTNFFWMFVEGLYLFLQVQASFSAGSLKLRHCACIGWGVPLLLTLLWTLLVYCQAQSQVVTMNNKQEGQARNPVNVSVLGCPFYESTAGDQTLELLAYTVPVCAILVCNTVFLVWIMGVVISKLRPSDPYHQTQNVNLRAAKALIIIVPLLGITYLVTIVGPSEPDTTLETIFILTRNVLLSFQGFFITLPYCFLNGEVCTMMKSHWERWRNTQDIGQGPNSARNSIAMQGFNSVCDNLTRKRSRSYSYHVVRGSLVDRRGTQESEMSNTTVKAIKKYSIPPQEDGPLDGPLVPHPDLIQHTQKRDCNVVN